MKALTFVAGLAMAIAPVAMAASHQSKGAPSSAPWVQGEVRKIDKEARKITLKHEEITNLQMPPMTMVFAVKEPPILDKVKVGDKVRFTADKVGGAYTVTGIEPARKQGPQ